MSLSIGIVEIGPGHGVDGLGFVEVGPGYRVDGLAGYDDVQLLGYDDVQLVGWGEGEDVPLHKKPIFWGAVALGLAATAATSYLLGSAMAYKR